MQARRIDYAALLRSRHLQAVEDRESEAPISLTEWKARQAIEAWRQRFVVALSAPPRAIPPQAEIAAGLRANTAQLVKVGGEIDSLQVSVDQANAEIARLQEIIAQGGEVTAELVDAANALAATLQTVDEKVPDLGT